MKRTALFRLDRALERDPAVTAWLAAQPAELGALARRWFAAMRACGDEVRELLHDGCPTACYGDVAFGYVNVFRAHVNVGFYQGSALPDPARLLEGTGQFMRHVKLKPDAAMNTAALRRLIQAAFNDARALLEQS